MPALQSSTWGSRVSFNLAVVLILSLLVRLPASIATSQSMAPASIHGNHSLPEAVTSPSQTTNSAAVQVGAYGDDNTVGDTGVEVEIRTHQYIVNSPELDAFWVGIGLEQGAFIQFGYEVAHIPGPYCLKGTSLGNSFICTGGYVTRNNSDTFWFWEYFPVVGSENNAIVSEGPTGSVGLNASWHLYTMMENGSNSWDFLLDGHQVDSLDVPASNWASAPGVAAEKAGGLYNVYNLTELGPVEFRNLAYQNLNGWRSVSALYPFFVCSSPNPSIASNCNSLITYGVASLGSNDIIVGSDIPRPIINGQPLWSSQVSHSGNSTNSTNSANGISRTETRIFIETSSLVIADDGSTQIAFNVAGFAPSIPVVVLLNAMPNGTLARSLGQTDSTGSYSGILTYRGPYFGPATLSATDNLADISNVLNMTVLES